MKVKPNLFLNMSPQTTEEGGLAFARNMKVDDDGNLVSDYGYKNIVSMANYNIVGHIVGLNNNVYFFCHTLVEDSYVDSIVEYDEVEETATKLTTTWTYSGGEIDGYVSTNQSGEKILTIAEYKEGGDVPLKHINLKPEYSNVEESLYTQAPACPTANLVLKDTYVKTIPNGVYVFFIRYKIRKDVYTNWFLCSRPIFGGTSEKITTLQGGLSYINLHKDSAKSFVFQLDFVQTANIDSYKEFQLGFIITHDEASDARIWKHFDISKFVTTKPHYKDDGYDDEKLIYFDYEDVEEANIDDLLETTYELYNVHNVTAFKNKLYISNYIESDFNPNLQNLANCISLTEVHSEGEYVDYKKITIQNTPLKYNIEKGYYDETVNDTSIASLLNRYTFDYSVTKLIKVNTKEKQDVVKFSLIWSDDYHPDIAFIYNIYNNLYGQQVFGPDYREPYNQDDSTINDHLGIKLVNSSTSPSGMSTSYFYQRSSNKHPWDDLGLTFAFGSISSKEKDDYSREGCNYFNSSTYGHWKFIPVSMDGDGEAIDCWLARDDKFNEQARTAMSNKIKEDVVNKSFWGKAYIEISNGTDIYNIGYREVMDLDNYAGYDYDNDNQNIHVHDLVPLASELFSTETISTTLQDYIEQWVYEAIIGDSRFKGVDENGTPIVSIYPKEIPVYNVSVKFKKFDFSLDEDDVESTDDKIYKNYRVHLTTTDYVSICTFKLKNSIFKVVNNVGDSVQASTLMPLSTYQPYIHFVDEHNIITNGIKLPQFTTKPAQSDKDIITLKYSIDLPQQSFKYKSCFISLINVGDIIIEGFDYVKDPNDNNTNIIHSIELDSMLYNLNDNITIKGLATGSQPSVVVDITDKAKYYSSGASYPPLAFGNCGYIAWEGDVPTDVKKFYIVVKRNKASENINNLIKASGYLPLVYTPNATELHDGYYGSWFCLVKKPSFKLSSDFYVSGKDIYSIDRTTTLKLIEFKNYIQTRDSVTYFIRSNFNLNYLSLTEEINDSIFTAGDASSGVKQVAKVINSATLSFIYELKSMYRDFSNKYFRPYDTDYKIDFDNTIRVSHVLSDETFNNSVFKFASADYYNVPTDRGIIVNLFNIGNNIFVHTKNAFYKFDGNQTIVSNNQDIQLQESEPFETGVTQILDSEYGYGGIDTKQSGCITFDSYFFYDKISNHIFAYSGNTQIQLIDGNIYKLLTYYKPKDCKAIHDELNCRVLFEFTSGRDEYKNQEVTYKTFTLSYNYKTKTFVSFHDLSLVNSFTGHHKVYSYISGLINLFNTDNSINTSPLVEEMNVNQIFGGATTACIVEFGSKIYKKQTTPFGIAVVLFPQDSIRATVDSIKYISDIQQLDTETQSTPIYDVLVNPQVTRNNPVANFYIITDSCISSLVTTTVDDTVRPNSLLDYKGFKYDMGFWTSNFFKNNINKIDIYNYGKKYPNRALDADNNSLVYGRYFILVFDFIADTPIKFEEIFMNNNRY